MNPLRNLKQKPPKISLFWKNKQMKITYLAVGSELLKGRIINTNLTNAGEMLRKYGYDLSRGVEIQDTREAIVAAVESEMQNADVVLMSGGLGPTSDDITKKTLAEIFGAQLVMHQPTLELLRGYFERRGKKISPRNEEQALVPDNCEVLLNLRGTAPGMLFRKEGKILVSMPGVPHEMLYLLENEVIPKIKQSFEKVHFQNHIFRVIGIFESNLADKIRDIEENFPPCLDISYLPRIDGIWLELTVRGAEKETENLTEILQKNVLLLRERLSDFLYTEGKLSLEEEILQLCKGKNVTLAVAESITGGTITSKLVKVSGASNYLKGGITTYFTETKTQILGVNTEIIEKEGVVSAEVAMKMAEGVKNLFKTDFAIATTGYAEPPVKGEFGSVWLGFAGKNGELQAQRQTLPYDRQNNIERAACLAMIFLLQNLKKENIEAH